MFSLENELEKREKKVALHKEKVVDLEAKEQAFLLAKEEVESLGDINEALDDIKVIKGYLGIKDEVEVEPEVIPSAEESAVVENIDCVEAPII